MSVSIFVDRFYMVKFVSFFSDEHIKQFVSLWKWELFNSILVIEKTDCNDCFLFMAGCARKDLTLEDIISHACSIH